MWVTTQQYMRAFDSLPIATHKRAVEAMISRLKDVDVVLFASPTGTGKSLGIPAFIVATERSRNPHQRVHVWVVQPRVAACRNLETNLCQMIGTSSGHGASYDCGGQRSTTKYTDIIYGTDGHFVNQLLNAASAALHGQRLSPLPTHFILDEAHCSSADTMFITLIVRYLRKLSREKLFDFIVCSATLNIETVRSYFPDYTIYESIIDTIRDYTIKVEYVPADLTTAGAVEQVTLEVRKRREVNDFTGNTLIILPSVNNVTKIALALERAYPGHIVCEIYGDMTEENIELMKTKELGVFFVSTDVTETSITLFQIDLVINVPWSMQMRDGKLVCLPTSTAQNTQRAGRTGRTCNGTVVHLQSEQELQKVPAYTPSQYETEEPLRQALSVASQRLDPSFMQLGERHTSVFGKLLDYGFVRIIPVPDSEPESSLDPADPLDPIRRRNPTEDYLHHRYEITERGKMASQLPIDLNSAGPILTALDLFYIEKISTIDFLSIILTICASDSFGSIIWYAKDVTNAERKELWYGIKDVLTNHITDSLSLTSSRAIMPRSTNELDQGDDFDALKLLFRSLGEYIADNSKTVHVKWHTSNKLISEWSNKIASVAAIIKAGDTDKKRVSINASIVKRIVNQFRMVLISLNRLCTKIDRNLNNSGTGVSRKTIIKGDYALQAIQMLAFYCSDDNVVRNNLIDLYPRNVCIYNASGPRAYLLRNTGVAYTLDVRKSFISQKCITPALLALHFFTAVMSPTSHYHTATFIVTVDSKLHSSIIESVKIATQAATSHAAKSHAAKSNSVAPTGAVRTPGPVCQPSAKTPKAPKVDTTVAATVAATVASTVAATLGPVCPPLTLTQIHPAGESANDVLRRLLSRPPPSDSPPANETANDVLRRLLSRPSSTRPPAYDRSSLHRQALVESSQVSTELSAIPERRPMPERRSMPERRPMPERRSIAERGTLSMLSAPLRTSSHSAYQDSSFSDPDLSHHYGHHDISQQSALTYDSHVFPPRYNTSVRSLGPVSSTQASTSGSVRPSHREHSHIPSYMSSPDYYQN